MIPHARVGATRLSRCTAVAVLSAAAWRAGFTLQPSRRYAFATQPLRSTEKCIPANHFPNLL